MVALMKTDCGSLKGLRQFKIFESMPGSAGLLLRGKNTVIGIECPGKHTDFDRLNSY